MTTPLSDERDRQRSFAHYIELVRRRWLLLLVPALVAAGVGGYLASQEAESFTATATVRVGDPSLPSGLFDARSSADLDQLLATSIEIMESDPVEDEVLAALDESTTGAYRDVEVTRVGETVLVDIEVTAADSDAALTIAQAWAETYVEIEVTRTVGALNRRAEELQSQIDVIDERLEEVNLAIAEEAEEIRAEAELRGDTVVISGNETPTLSGLTQQRDDLLTEQSELRQRAGEFEVEAALRSSVVEVAFPADASTEPIGGSPVRSAAVAGMLGLLLGAGLAVARDELDDRIHDADDLESAVRGVPILAAVPGSLRRRRSAPLVLDPEDPRAEAFRTLRTNFEFIASSRVRKDRGRIVMVTSPMNSEGKSTTAANLSASLVSLGRSVVLVDADLRRGTLHELFGARAQPGLVNALVDEHPLDTTLQLLELEYGDLFLLPGGRHLSPAELFATPRFERLVADLAQVADYVILDAPPVLPVSDALAAARQADEVVVVVGAGRTRRPQLRTAMESIRQLDLPVLGFVLNGAGRVAHGYYESTTPRQRARRGAPLPGSSRTDDADLDSGDRRTHDDIDPDDLEVDVTRR